MQFSHSEKKATAEKGKKGKPAPGRRRASDLDPLYSVQLIENSVGISAMMVIQFSKETHFGGGGGGGNGETGRVLEREGKRRRRIRKESTGSRERKLGHRTPAMKVRGKK